MVLAIMRSKIRWLAQLLNYLRKVTTNKEIQLYPMHNFTGLKLLSYLFRAVANL